MSIDKFDGEYAFLSNFYEAPMVIDGITYPTNEHYFQAMKAKSKAEHLKIAAAATPGEAKRLGRKCELKPNWEQIKDRVMLIGLFEKFTQNPQLKKRLLETGNAKLIEGNTWHDTYWGVCYGVGANKLGELLMALREDFLNEFINELGQPQS